MIILLIYIAIFVVAFFAVRLVARQVAKARDFTSLKTVTFGDESAVTADRSASIISIVAIFLIWGAFTGSSWSPIHAPGPFVGETSFTYTAEAEDGTRRTFGNQFLSRDRRLFFGGIETTVLPSGEAFEADRSPREFINPGEPGFLSMTPRYDCGEIMSALPWDLEGRG